MNTTKISIITPSFNQGMFLEKTIVSVITQNYSALEYIIIDGGSIDNSIEIIKKYEKYLTFWSSEKDKGQSDAINKGMSKANGEIVAWLNSDDLYFPYTLERVAKVFCENPQIDVIYGDVENFYPDGNTEIYCNQEFDVLDFLSRVSIHQPSVFWRRRVFDKIGWLDTSLYYLMDYDFWVRLFFNVNVLKVPELLSRFRVHDSAKTHNNPEGLYLEYRKIYCRFMQSCNVPQFCDQLKILNLWFNTEAIEYNLTKIPDREIIYQSFCNYVLNCMKQEYSFGHRKFVNQLFLNPNNPVKTTQKLPLFIKNNIGVAEIKRKFYAK